MKHENMGHAGEGKKRKIIILKLVGREDGIT